MNGLHTRPITAIRAFCRSALHVPLTAARPAAAVMRDAMRSANAAHGYPLALREADATTATALRRALLHGA